MIYFFKYLYGIGLEEISKCENLKSSNHIKLFKKTCVLDKKCIFFWSLELCFLQYNSDHGEM